MALSSCYQWLKVMSGRLLICLIILPLRFVVCYDSCIGEECRRIQLHSHSDDILTRLSTGNPSNEEPCYLTPLHIHINRQSEMLGFHRKIVTDVAVELDTDASCERCRFILLEFLPKGMFVDIYQLSSLQEFGGPGVISFEEISVEKPAYISPNHSIAVYSDEIEPAGGQVNTSIALPVHLRYHRPSKDPSVHYAEVYLPSPTVLMNCYGCSSNSCTSESISDLILAPCTAANHSICRWTPLPNNSEQWLKFPVPVGQAWHSIPVTAITILAIMCGTVTLLLMIVRNKASSTPDYKAKQR